MRMRYIITTASLLLVSAFVGIMFLVLTNNSLSEHHHSDTSSHEGCPFMSHEDSICPMTALNHLALLRDIFEALIPSLLSLALLAGVATFVYVTIRQFKPILLFDTHTLWRWRIFVTYSFVMRIYQDLFARGILNPKLF